MIMMVDVKRFYGFKSFFFAQYVDYTHTHTHTYIYMYIYIYHRGRSSTLSYTLV